MRCLDRPATLAQVVEIHAALEKIKDDSGRWNISGAMLKRELEEGTGTGNASPPKVPPQRKTGQTLFASDPLFSSCFWCGWQDSNPRPLGS